MCNRDMVKIITQGGHSHHAVEGYQVSGHSTCHNRVDRILVICSLQGHGSTLESQKFMHSLVLELVANYARVTHLWCPTIYRKSITRKCQL